MEDNQDLRKRARVLFPELMGAPVTEEERISVQARAEEIDKEFGTDYDIRSQLLSSRDPLTGMLRDLKIDDRDLPLAKNYYDWCTGGFIGKLHAPWVRQMIISLIFFGEVCPRCSKKSWLRDITNIPKDLPLEGLVERVQLLEHGVCPSCGANKLELYKSGEMKIFQELVLVWGQRSGKSTSLAMMASYHTHRFLKLPPFGSLTTGMQASTPLTFSFVSLTYGKAVAVLWEPVLSVIDQCTWYKNYFELMDFYGKKYGTELYNKKLQFIRFTYKNLNLIPTHPGWEALRGECVVGSTMVNTSGGFLQFDELGFTEGQHAIDERIDTPSGQKQISHSYRAEDRPVWTVRTRNGYEITGTKEHPLLVLSDKLKLQWVELRDLRPGDWIVSTTKQNQPMFGSAETSLDVATILGSMTANGYKGGFSSADPVAIEAFYSAVRNELGVTPVVYSKDKTRVPTHYVTKGSRGGNSENRWSFTEQLKEWGYASKKSSKKQIPHSIRTAPKEVLHEYLESYFACDSEINGGSVGAAKDRGLTTNPEIQLVTASKKLARQIHVILLHVYGIVGRLRREEETRDFGKGPKVYVTWNNSLSGYDAMLFLNTFKRAKVQKYANRFKDVPAGLNNDRRRVPHIHKLLHSLLDVHKADKRCAYHTRSGSTTRFSLRDHPLLRSKLAHGVVDTGVPEYQVYDADWSSTLPFIESLNPSVAHRIQKLLEIGAHFERVESVQKEGKKRTVYDVTVPNGHAFTANGLTSHNTRFGAALDELGLFPLPSGDDSDQVEGEDDENGGSGSAMTNDRKMANADEAHTSLNNSLVTVQEASLELLKEGKFHIPTGLMFGVSSPQSHRDKVMRLLRESQTEEGSKTMLGSQLPTWEVNPKLHRDSPRIARLYASNPEKAERDFGANPPRVHSVFIRPQIIVPAFKGPRSTHTLDYDFSVEEKIRGKLKQRTQTEFASVMSIDAGYSNNSFTICSTYFDFKTGKSHTTTVLELIPSQKRKIDFEAMYSEVILPLAKATNTAVLLADQWNSLSTLSRLEKDIEGLVAKQLSPRRKHFDAARQMLVEGSVILPKSEIELDELFSTHVDSYRKHFTGKPVAHLAYQMSTVRDMHPQRPPEKPEVGTDDIFRAWVLGVSVIHQPRVQKLLQEMQERIKKRRNHQGMSAVYVPRGVGGFR